ncbi:MAG: LacI family DNA-binding transcriptional regulator [Anaerolineales bacterium]|nr:LacI family DNA-binding transcriptional regulator [Anaerolineales bacterium]
MTTIREIARQAGVSVKTVSRVINREPMVGEATRNRVLAIMKSLNYVPNVAAQRLARGRSQVIGLLFQNATWAYLHDVLEGSLSIARDRGYSILTRLVDVRTERDREELLQMVAEQRVDGYLFTPPCDNAPELLDALHQRTIPFVRLTPHNRELPYPHVTASDFLGAREITDKLIALGHRRIGFIMGDTDHIASHDRLAGYRAALQANGLSFDPRLVLPGDWQFKSGTAGGAQLLQRRPRPTAIFASNDDMAAGVLSAAHRLGITVPAELSVAGFDDVPLAEQVWPPLTTVRQPIQQIARQASHLLIDLLEGKTLPALHYEFPTELIVRESTSLNPEAAGAR